MGPACIRAHAVASGRGRTGMRENPDARRRRRRRCSLRLLATFEFRIATRWSDFDALGHLNHAAYHVFLDEARDDALRRTVGDFDTWPNVVAHASIDYRREVPLGVREVVVRTAIVEVGRSSVRLEQQVLSPDGTTAADAAAVLVAWDRTTRSSRAITAAERARLLEGVA